MKKGMWNKKNDINKPNLKRKRKGKKTMTEEKLKKMKAKNMNNN